DRCTDQNSLTMRHIDLLVYTLETVDNLNRGPIIIVFLLDDNYSYRPRRLVFMYYPNYSLCNKHDTRPFGFKGLLLTWCYIVVTVITNDNIKFFVTNLLSLGMNPFPNLRSCR